MSYAVVKNGGLLGFGLWGLGAFVGNATIKPGSGNVALVKQLQTFLGVKADGSFGPNTTTAVAAFQKAHGLTPDGTVGAATWAAMDAAQAGGQGGAVTPGGAAAPQPCPAGTHFTGMTPQGAQVCEQDAATPTVGVGPGQMIDTGPGGGAAVPAGGGAPAGGAAPGALAKAKNWWGSQTTTTKGMVVGGAVLGVVLLSMMFGGGPSPAREPYTGTSQSTATPNRRRRRKKAMKKNGRRRSRRRGRTVRAHRVAPAKYRRMGATSPSDYAYPAGFMYPIRFHKGRKVKRRTTMKHIRAAASRFGKFSRRYPPRVRKQIRARIQRAERQYHIGRYR